jgi:hypothetical protein
MLAKIVLSLTRIKSMPPELRKSLQTNAEWVIRPQNATYMAGEGQARMVPVKALQ